MQTQRGSPRRGNPLNSRWLFYLVTIVALAVDLGSKSVIGRVMSKRLVPGQAVEVLELQSVKNAIAARLAHGKSEDVFLADSPVLGITWALNPGGVFGVGQGAGVLFALASVFAIGVILWLLYSAPAGRLLPQVALGLILSGALGNLYDRIFINGCVRDFINFHFRVVGIKWPAFNIADSAITVGCSLLVILMLFESSWRQSPRRAHRDNL